MLSPRRVCFAAVAIVALLALRPTDVLARGRGKTVTPTSSKAQTVKTKVAKTKRGSSKKTTLKSTRQKKNAPSVRPAPRNLQSRKSYLSAMRRATAAIKKIKGRGLVRLNETLPTIVIPDVHARTDYLSKVLKRTDKATGKTYGSLLKAKKVQVVVLGDGMHSEGRAADRWLEADANPNGSAMRAEVAESLGTMKQIMEFKAEYPEHFHYIKGNHDNIQDWKRGGDWPVVKYSDIGEGRLIKDYVTNKFGKGFVKEFAAFERALPLVAVGKGFVLSHSGPASAMKAGAINKRSGKVVENFTWTDLTRSSAKQARIADKQLALLGQEGGFYLAGHRETGNRTHRRQGSFYQVNSDTRLHFAVLQPGQRFRPRKDLHDAY